MKIGQIIKNLNLGFIKGGDFVVTKVEETLISLKSVNAKEGGILSHMNETNHSIDFIKQQMEENLKYSSKPIYNPHR